MLWTLLSIVVAFAELIAFMSADWLIGRAKPWGPEEMDNRTGGPQEPYRPTLGIYGRCTRISHMQFSRRDTLCGPYAENFGEIASGFWQATAIFLALGIMILCTVAFVSVFTMCVQSIMKKSIFNVCGLLQGIAGMCLAELLIFWVIQRKKCSNSGLPARQAALGRASAILYAGVYSNITEIYSYTACNTLTLAAELQPDVCQNELTSVAFVCCSFFSPSV